MAHYSLKFRPTSVLRDNTMSWILENNGFIFEAIIMSVIIIYVGIKVS